MYLEYDAIVPTSRNPGANHAKLRDFRVVLFGVYFSSSIPAYPFYHYRKKFADHSRDSDLTGGSNDEDML